MPISGRQTYPADCPLDWLVRRLVEKLERTQMRVDDMSGETLEYWSDQAVARLAGLREYGGDDKVLRIAFEDDAPDPLNSPADTMAVMLGLRINLTCEYTPGGFLIANHNAWTARCGWPGLREISIRGDTEQEAVTRLFVAMVIGRVVSETPNVELSGAKRRRTT